MEGGGRERWGRGGRIRGAFSGINKAPQGETRAPLRVGAQIAVVLCHGECIHDRAAHASGTMRKSREAQRRNKLAYSLRGCHHALHALHCFSFVSGVHVLLSAFAGQLCFGNACVTKRPDESACTIEPCESSAVRQFDSLIRQPCVAITPGSVWMHTGVIVCGCSRHLC